MFLLLVGTYQHKFPIIGLHPGAIREGNKRFCIIFTGEGKVHAFITSAQN
jgi:hypothetical protein